MAVFEYKVRKNGIVEKGKQEGTLSDLRRDFIEKGYLILSLREIRVRETKNAPASPNILGFIKDLFTFRKQISSKRLSEFSSQFSILLDAGMTIPESIKLLVKNEKNLPFKAVLEEIEKEINQGVSLSETIKKRKGKFPPIFEMAVRTGEYSGQMSAVFKELADYFEKIEENKSKIIGVCIYPVVLTVFLAANMVVMSIKVIPIFKEVFADFQDQLPITTKAIFIVADFIRYNYLLIIALLAAVPFFAAASLRNVAVRKLLDRALLKIPVIKKLIIDNSVNSFLKSLALLLKNGMTIIEALEPSINIVGNYVVRSSLRRDTQAIIEGKPLNELLKDNRYISNIAKTLMETGENSAKFDITLEKAIFYYNNEINRRVDRVNRLMEPALIIIFGLIIAVVVISLAVPIFKISSGSLMK